MMEIWPAGPPKLIKPNLSQYQNASVKETGAGEKFEEVSVFLLVVSISTHFLGKRPKIDEQTLDALRLDAGRLRNPQ